MQEWQEKIEQEVEHLKEEVKHLREQVTEPIKIARIELDPSGIQKRLNEIAQTQADHGERFDTLKIELKQEFHTVSDTWLDTLQEHYTDHKNDIAELKGLVMQLLQQKPSE